MSSRSNQCSSFVLFGGGHTIPRRVRYLLQVQEVGCQGNVSHLGIIENLNFDSLSQWRELLDEGDLLVPNGTAGGAGNGCFTLNPNRTVISCKYTIHSVFFFTKLSSEQQSQNAGF